MKAASGYFPNSMWLYLGVLVAAASLSGTIAIASVSASAPPEGQAADETIAVSTTVDTRAAKARKRTRCEECGIVQAIRRIDAVDGHPPTYEVTIRLRNGSMRTNTNATPGNWQPGDRIMLIKGGRAAKTPTV